jgi:hypothetical protein
MGIGRREFLLQFGAVIASLAATSGAAAAAVDDLYINRRHGIAFRKPQGWEFHDLRDIGRTKAGMLLDLDGFDPDAWAEMLSAQKKFEAFVVAADMRCARLAPGATSEDATIAPGVSVSYEGTWEEDGPAPDAPSSLTSFVARDLHLFRQGYGEFRFLKPPASPTVSGCEAVEYTARYLYAHRYIQRPIPMRERVLYVHQVPAIYSIRMFDYPEITPPLEHQFDEVIASLRVL